MAAIKTAAALSISPLTQLQLDSVHALQRLVMASAWSQEVWLQVLGARYYTRIAIADGTVCGAVVFSCVLDEAELETVFVHPAFRSQGVASALLKVGFSSLPAAVSTVFLEVDTENTAAIALYERFLFTVVNIRKAYYKNTQTNGDALIMQRQQ